MKGKGGVKNMLCLYRKNYHGAYFCTLNEQHYKRHCGILKLIACIIGDLRRAWR